MVQGTNKTGEVSAYTFNGLGVRVGTERILEDNSHGYTDFHGIELNLVEILSVEHSEKFFLVGAHLRSPLFLPVACWHPSPCLKSQHMGMAYKCRDMRILTSLRLFYHTQTP